MNFKHFEQLNLAGVVERAQQIIVAIKELGLRSGYDGDIAVVEIMRANLETGDDWERMAIDMVRLELMERQMRREDPQVESQGPNFNGGFPI